MVVGRGVESSFMNRELGESRMLLDAQRQSQHVEQGD